MENQHSNFFRAAIRLSSWLAITGIFVGVSAWSEEDVKAIRDYLPPKAIVKYAATYPRINLQNREEGWVIIQYMVDIDGKPFEPVVLDSLGGRQFEEAAIKAMLKAQYEPAVEEGEKIVGTARTRYTFRLDQNGTGASRRFVSVYKSFMKALEAGEREETEKKLLTLESNVKNIYESAFLNFAKFYHASKYADKVQQLRYLRQAMFFDDQGNYKTFLPEELENEAWKWLYTLEVENKNFSEAMSTYEIIKKYKSEEVAAILQKSYESLQELKLADNHYVLNGVTGEFGTWSVGLFKDEFFINNNTSAIQEVKLFCDKKFLTLDHDPEKQYKIPESYGDCTVIVYSDADVKFDLVQL